MKLIARYQPVRTYIEHLCVEIALVAAQLPARMKVAHLHFGGGTPTAIHPEDLEKIVRKIEKHFTFTPDAERAIETDPRTITDEMIARIGALGFTRASLGVRVQSPSPRQYRKLSRSQSLHDVALSYPSLLNSCDRRRR